jgi:Flp pilus assembly protein TadD
MAELGPFSQSSNRTKPALNAMDVDRNKADREYARGVQHRQQNQLAEALACYERAIELAPDHARAHNNIGVIRQQWGDPQAAQAAYRKAVEADPQFGLAWFNLGNCFRQDNRLDEAQSVYRRALALMPGDAETQINLAIVLRELRQFDDSLGLLGEIPAASAEHGKARLNIALVRLMRGELGPGWDEYEGRLAIEPDVRSIPADRRWDGTPLGSRSMLVLSEQGIGDQVMFASCLPDLGCEASARDAARILVECDHRLVPLFARSFPQVKPFPKMTSPEALPSIGHVDIVEPIGSLPRFLRRRLEDFPQRRAILRVDSERLPKWRSSFARLGGALKVGISWQGGKDFETRRRRSTALDLWEPIFKVPGVRFVNLQYGPAAAEATDAARRFGITLDDGADCDPLVDLDDFAAKIAALDLVLSVDNSTVHLAAAIGRPVWTLLPFAADWRWMLAADIAPWYPSMRLLRCQRPDNWSELLRRVARGLTAASISRDLLTGAA